jgi:hypothetical protein
LAWSFELELNVGMIFNWRLGLINKQIDSCDQAVEGVFDGASIMLGGFGNAGMPGQLIDALHG